MERTTPVHAAINSGREKAKLMDAAHPVQTAASKTMMVKIFIKRETNIPILSILSFLQVMSYAPKEQKCKLERWRPRKTILLLSTERLIGDVNMAITVKIKITGKMR